MNLVLCCSFAICVSTTIGALAVETSPDATSASGEKLSLLMTNGDSVRVARRASRYRQPFVVAIIDRRSREAICDGSIIDNSHVITAAHCFDSSEAGNLYIASGIEYLDRAGYGSPSTIDIESIHPHPAFSSAGSSYVNDIAVVKVTTPFRFSRNIQPIPLANFEAFDGTSCSTVGWGIVNSEGNQPNSLQEADVVIHTTASCGQDGYNQNSGAINVMEYQRNGAQNTYSGRRHKRQSTVVNNNVICTLPEEGSVKPCLRDSGSPLICNNELHGVASYGSVYCRVNHKPTYFTKVLGYKNWLAGGYGNFNANSSHTQTPQTTDHHRTNRPRPRPSF